MSRSRKAEARYRSILEKRRKGETLASLAQRQGANLRTLYGWHQRLAKRARSRGEQEAESVALVPVETGPVALNTVLAPSFEVVLRASGHVVHVPARFDAAALRRLVETLEA